MVGFGLSVVAVLCELLLICLPAVGLVLMAFLLVDYLVGVWLLGDLRICLVVCLRWYLVGFAGFVRLEFFVFLVICLMFGFCLSVWAVDFWLWLMVLV